tara:strand:+ start:139 stop:894 length:756 start_codon:yes stop_codon:yes gene_type:complete
MKKKKYKNLVLYKLFSLLPKKYLNFFNSFFRFKLHHHINYLLKKKLLIDVVYDIGAYEGEWSLFMRNTCLKDSSFYLFEANNKHEHMIKSRGFKYHMGVLSDEIKNVNFYSKNHQGDSYYLEQTNYYEKDLEPLNLKTNTLDQIILEKNFKLPDLIKMDTQGSELDILKGASKSIHKCKLIYLECPVISYNKNSPNFVHYIEHLDSLGFIPLDVCDIAYVDKILIQMDILFIKRDLVNKIFKQDKILNILN